MPSVPPTPTRATTVLPASLEALPVNPRTIKSLIWTVTGRIIRDRAPGTVTLAA